MKNISANKLLKMLDNQWCDTKQIMVIGSCGKNKALEIKRAIKSELSDDYYLPNNLVPMEKVIDYFRINISYLKKVAREVEDAK